MWDGLELPWQLGKEVSKAPLEKTRASLLPTNHGHLTAGQPATAQGDSQPKNNQGCREHKFYLIVLLKLHLSSPLLLSLWVSFAVTHAGIQGCSNTPVQQGKRRAGSLDGVNLCSPHEEDL